MQYRDMLRGLDRWITGNYGEDQFKQEKHVPPEDSDPSAPPTIYDIHPDDYEEDHAGICLSCGEIASGCEPDARNYVCESCGAHEVFGMEEALLMGRINLIDPDND